LTLTHDERWPELAYDEWKDTYATLRLWMQVVGKVKLRLCPFLNHWWQTAFRLSPRGIRSGLVPFHGRALEVEFDFIDHVAKILVSDGSARAMALAPRSVASFYAEMMELLESVGVAVHIDRDPKEVPDPIPFDQDSTHASYDRASIHRFWKILIQCDRLFNVFRGGFVGKSSPVHFFWGSFDLAVSRFSGRRAPLKPEADHITQLGYSHEVSSVGFWPGSGNILEPAFYSYCAPEPLGFPGASVAPGSAFYNPPTRGFVLKYADVRKSTDPDRAVLEFCQSTYDAAADRGRWDRDALERHRVPWRHGPQAA
jgi:hypothetical protein